MIKLTALLLIGTAVCLCIAGSAYAQGEADEIQMIFQERQEAFRKKDYGRLWETQPESDKRGRFKNNIEEMKTWIESFPPEVLESIDKERITKINFITQSRAHVEADPPSEFGGYYLVKENGKWRFDILYYRLQLVSYKLKYIGNQVREFYKKHERLPRDIDEVIAFSPGIEEDAYDVFDDAKEPYRLIISDDVLEWKLYSIGPDGNDDKGSIVYDPKYGLFSSGDIVFTQKDTE